MTERGFSFSPADMPQRGIPTTASEEAPLREPIPYDPTLLSTRQIISPTSGEDYSGLRQPKTILNDDIKFVKSVRRALNGGNPDMIARKKPGPGKSFRHI